MVAKAILVIFSLHLVHMKYTMGQYIPIAAIPEPCAPTPCAPTPCAPTFNAPTFSAPSAFTSALEMQMPYIPAPSFAVSSDDLTVAGMVTVTGAMPFLGTVSLAGELPASGQGVVMYNCGNGDIGIVRELPFAGVLAPMGSVFC